MASITRPLTCVPAPRPVAFDDHPARPPAASATRARGDGLTSLPLLATASPGRLGPGSDGWYLGFACLVLASRSFAPVGIDSVGDGDVRVAGHVGVGRELGAHLVEHCVLRGFVEYRDVAHRAEPVDDFLDRHDLFMMERGLVQRTEERRLGEGRLAPLVVLAPRCVLLDAIHDRPQRIDVRCRAVARVPHQPEPTVGSENAGALLERDGRVEPVKGLGHGDGIKAGGAERHELRGTRDDAHLGAGPGEQAAHAVDRFGREELGAERFEQPGELAGAGREVEDIPAGSDAEVLREPRDRVGRITGPGAFVALRLQIESGIGHLMDGHPAMMAAMPTQESISFEAVAAIYDATRGGLERGVRFASALAPQCGPGPVLEIGVGTGAIALPLRNAIGRTVVGVDLSPAMLALAQARLGSTVGVGDASGLPFATSSVGTAVACWVLHLVGDPVAVLVECRRVLAPGGHLVVVSSRGETEPDDIEGVMIDLHDVIRGRLDVRERLVPLAAAAGLDLVGEEVTGPGNWLESPMDLVERMELRQWGALIDLDDARFAQIVAPVVERLKALPEPDRKRARVGRHRMFRFTPR